MLSHLRWAALLVLLTAMPVVAQQKKYSVKTVPATAPKELKEPFSTLLAPSAVQFFDPAGKLICEMWFCKVLPTTASAAQIKSGITYRDLKETQLIGAVRFDKNWQDYRKQKIKAGVYTMRLGFQPMDGDHSGKSEFTEFLVVSALDKDTSPAVMAPKAMQEMSGKTTGSGHPGVFMLFPNSKPGQATVVSKPRDHWVVNVGCPVQAGGVQGMLGFGITLVGEADD